MSAVARPSALYLEALESRLVLSSLPLVGDGTGLSATYFSDMNLTTPALSRTDASVNFDWGTGAPAAGLPVDHFSARWTGTLQAPATGTYTLSTLTDDGVRLYINNQLVINDWTNHSAKEDSATLTLTAGQSYDLRMEYFENSGGAVAKLSWSGPSLAKSIIPTTALAPASAPTTTTLPTPWQQADIGKPLISGSTTVSGTTFTVTGSGSDIWGTADQCHYVYQPISGDGQIITQVSSLTSSDTWAKSGVMFRDSLDASAKEVGMLLTAGSGGGAQFEYRTATSGSAAWSGASATPVAAPYYVKLVRNGSLFSGYVSASGADNTWTLAGTTTVAMGHTIYAGLALTSHNTSTTVTSAYINPTVSQIVPLGANLDGVRDWSLSSVFVDMAKQVRLFSGTAGADGWPTGDAQYIFQTGALNSGHALSGTYKLSFTGKATLDTSWTPNGSITNQVYNSATNTTTADVSFSAADNVDGWYLTLIFSNTNGGIKNLHLIRPGYSATNPPTFTNEFLNLIAPFTTLRTMDFTATNSSKIVNWSDRAKVTDALQSSNKGVAWEYAIQLANQTHKDLWINIPAMATNDYITQLATLLKNTLSPDRAVYVEYSNETWNSICDQYKTTLADAKAQISANGGSCVLNYDSTTNDSLLVGRRTVQRSKEISDIFATVMGTTARNARFRVVLGTQASSTALMNDQLLFAQRTYGPTANYFYSLAIAPYFNMNGQDSNTHLTTDQVISALSSSVSSLPSSFAAFDTLANSYGLLPMCYEGGRDTYGSNNISAKKNAALDPRMTSIVTTYLSNWYSAGGTLFNWYTGAATSYDTQYGTWGITNDISNLNTPTIQGIKSALTLPIL